MTTKTKHALELAREALSRCKFDSLNMTLTDMAFCAKAAESIDETLASIDGDGQGAAAPVARAVSERELFDAWWNARNKHERISPWDGWMARSALAAAPAQPAEPDEVMERAAFQADAKRRGWKPGNFMLAAYAGWLARAATSAPTQPAVEVDAPPLQIALKRLADEASYASAFHSEAQVATVNVIEGIIREAVRAASCCPRCGWARGHDYGCPNDPLNPSVAALAARATTAPASNAVPDFDRCATCGITKRMAIPDNCVRKGCPLKASSAAKVEGAEWQLIEAAPRDGRTLLLGYFNSAGRWRTLRGQWFPRELIDEQWENAEDCEEGWYETPVEGEEEYLHQTMPTHWMRLPAAPHPEAAPASSEQKGAA